jgi:RNA polymerase sigma factor (TIGR02999 family)
MRATSADRTITALLGRWHRGERGAADALGRRVYDDLRRIAWRQLGPARAGDDLGATVLVHESFLRLLRQRGPFVNRHHFFALATRMMLRSLADERRRAAAARRGGDHGRAEFAFTAPPERGAGPPTRALDAEALAAAIDRLERLDARKADVVRLRLVWGLDKASVAAALGMSRRTAERDWAFAKAWLAGVADGNEEDNRER